MSRSIIVAVLIGLIVGCAPQPPTATPEPMSVVTSAVSNIRKADTFRIAIEQTGASYSFDTSVGKVQFRRAIAQYVAPDVLEAHLRLIVAGLPADVGIFARGANQWFQNDVITAGLWVNTAFSPGFNPGTLIASEGGFQAAVQALTNLAYMGEETLETGTGTQHFKADAKGEQVAGLVANLIPLVGMVTVDVFVDPRLLLPVRFIVVEPEVTTKAEPKPQTFTVDIYDVNAKPALNDPQATPMVKAS